MQARYDEFAEWYEQWIGDAPPQNAAHDGLLPAVAGDRVLDIACGQGRMSRYLAALGADVVGIELVDHSSAAVCTLPPAEVYEDILAVRSYANGVMDRTGHAPRRADLTLAAGWLSCLLGVAACDMGEHAAARAWCSDAERLSQDARHPQIAGWAALTRSLVAYYQGQPRQSASLAARGQQLAPAGTAIRVKLAAQEMRAAAMTGDAAHMNRARRHAARQMTLIPAFTGGLGAFSVPAGEDPPYTATSLLLVGRYSEAATATSRLITTSTRRRPAPSAHRAMPTPSSSSAWRTPAWAPWTRPPPATPPSPRARQCGRPGCWPGSSTRS